MKKLKVILFTVFMACVFFSTDAKAVTTSRWMGQIDNNKSLSDISIPGTHDSGALYEPVKGTAKCQDLNIWDQLNIGVRYLDIRCRECEDSFTIHHGSVYQHSNFDDVLNACSTFLRNNPSETIIMSVKEEYNGEKNTKSFDQVFNNYVNKNRSIWFLENRIPKLGEVRGKIVLFRRFSAANWMGINTSGWRDNATFSLNNGVGLSIQDCYKVGNNDNKWNEITSLYNRAAQSRGNELFVNYTSGYKSILGVPNINGVSNDINKRLLNYFSNGNIHNHYGISAIDFIDNNLSNRIINTNF